MSGSALLDVAGLSVEFPTARGSVRAVDALSFQVARGETLAVVGESGSGKSTAQLALIDLLPAARTSVARVVFDGRDVTAPAARRALRGREVGFVFQDPLGALHPLLTIERQLTEVLETHEGLARAKARDRAVAALEEVGVPSARERLDAYPHELSGGLRQRVTIALALIARPKLLVADEPTTALDVTLQRQVLELLATLRRERGLGVVLVTHSLGVVAHQADRVLVMYAGRAVEEGPVDEVLAAPRHPYTRALLQSIPRLDGDPTEPLPAIGGAPPDLARLPAGCAFAPRCPIAVERCTRERPELVHLDTEGRASTSSMVRTGGFVGTAADRATACFLAREFAEAPL